MPNIDTSTIEGFQDMTAEQKVEALLKAEIPEAVDLSQYVAKKTFDEKASEAAELSKKLKGKMSEDEAAKAQAEADRKELEGKYQELLKRSTVADHTARFLALGYEEKLARETAEALYDGNMEKVFENQQKANEAAEKELRAELVKKDPKPAGAGGDGGEKDDAVEFAKSLGKQRAEAMKQSVEGLKRYF
nr:MAG TPA: hypothetical protein [Caudoviricetes sp.]